MREIEHFELVSLDQARKIAALDSGLVSTNPNKYKESNVLSYYLVTNTWLLCVKTYAEYAWARLAEKISTDGLITTIRWCQDDADRIVHGDFTQLSWFSRSLIREIDRVGRPIGQRLEPDKNIGKDTMASLLFLLRYPKRFSPNNADIIQDDTLKDFIETEKRTKRFQRAELSRYHHDNNEGYSPLVMSLVREEIASMYDWDKICNSIEELDVTDIQFSSGAGYDAGPSVGSKLKAIYKKHPEYFPTPFGVRMVPIPASVEEEDRVCRVICVPKSYKAGRIVAPEDTYRNSFGKAIESIFRREDRTHHELNLEDQSINQEFARVGSETGEFSTLDASHASDLISVSHFRGLFPQRFVNLVLPLFSEYCEIKGRTYQKQMLSTAGHTLTFRIETIVYKAVVRAASRFNALFSGAIIADPASYDADPWDYTRVFGWAYGDDAICLTKDAATVLDFFEKMGMIVNQSKSFTEATSPIYRESCGEEYLDGQSMTSVYFPRFPIVGTAKNGKFEFSKSLINDEYRGKIDDATTMLIDLQKKLFNISYPASRFVYCVVKSVIPRITTSIAGDVCPDLWEYDDTGVVRPIKSFQVVTDTERYPCSQAVKSINRRIDEISCRLPEAVQRAAGLDTYHYAPYVAYDGREYDDLEVRLYELYQYQDFLKNGPSYDSPLDRLLNVSSRPAPISTFYGKRRLAWRWQLI